MFDYEKAEKAFKEENLFTKEELVASFKGYMDYVATEDETGVSEAMRERRLNCANAIWTNCRAAICRCKPSLIGSTSTTSKIPR